MNTNAEPPTNIFDPGNACLIVGTPSNPGETMLTDYILRTHDQQQTALTFFDTFLTGTLSAQAGVTIILHPQTTAEAAGMNALGLTVGNLDALSQWSSGLFVGVIGISSPDVLAFGGGDFINSVGIVGAPVTIYSQDYTNTGVYANQFITDTGLVNGYRLGFITEPNEPFRVPESDGTCLLLGLIIIVLTLRKIFRRNVSS